MFYERLNIFRIFSSEYDLEKMPYAEGRQGSIEESWTAFIDDAVDRNNQAGMIRRSTRFGYK